MQQVMQAIIVTGGKQYNVSEGDTLFIEKLDVTPATPWSLIRCWPSWTARTPSSVLPWWRVPSGCHRGEERQGKKIRIFKYTPKKLPQTAGSSSAYTKVEITAING